MSEENCTYPEKPLDEWFWHEFLDRTSNVLDVVDRQLLNHHVCCKDKEAARLVSVAAGALAQLYQYAGEQRYPRTPRPVHDPDEEYYGKGG